MSPAAGSATNVLWFPDFTAFQPRTNCSRLLGGSDVHFVLARGGYCPQRSRLLGVLRRWHRRRCVWTLCSLVHPWRNAVFVCCARSVRRELFDVRAGRRLSRGERS